MTASGQPDAVTIAAALIDLAHRRGQDKSLCPSEAARSLASDWRPLMPAVRAEAARLQGEGRLRATQRGAEVDAAAASGPIRLSLPRTP